MLGTVGIVLSVMKHDPRLIQGSLGSKLPRTVDHPPLPHPISAPSGLSTGPPPLYASVHQKKRSNTYGGGKHGHPCSFD